MVTPQRRLFPFEKDGVLAGQLFTGVIASREALRDPERRARIQLVLNELQVELDRLHGSEDDKYRVATDWSAAKDSYRLEGPPYNLSEDQRRSLSELALHELLRRDVFARSVHVERRAWRCALTVWGLWRGSVDTSRADRFRKADFFSVCVDNTLARAAAPWRRRALSYLRTMGSALQLGLVFMAFLGYFVYMLSKVPEAVAFIRGPGSLVTLVLVVVVAIIGALRASRH
jgi:hypothetical protein